MRITVFFLVLFSLASCYRVQDTIEPSFQYAVQDRYLQSRPSAFPPLNGEELSQPYGQEMAIGLKLARSLELYQAITAFRRAEILLPEGSARLLQIQYEILFCYYMGQQWEEVLATFNRSELRYVNETFPPFHDLLLILYETYRALGKEMPAEQMLQKIGQDHPKEGNELLLESALSEGNLPYLRAQEEKYPFLTPLLSQYESEKKQVGKAQALNALMPGAGYLYLGQKQSALTAFLLNSLFIGASVYFFETHNVAAGAIFATFEAGWYFGGIYGVGLETKAYNERLYESMAMPLLYRHNLFPALKIQYAF